MKKSKKFFGSALALALSASLVAPMFAAGTEDLEKELKDLEAQRVKLVEQIDQIAGDLEQGEALNTKLKEVKSKIAEKERQLAELKKQAEEEAAAKAEAEAAKAEEAKAEREQAEARAKEEIAAAENEVKEKTEAVERANEEYEKNETELKEKEAELQAIRDKVNKTPELDYAESLELQAKMDELKAKIEEVKAKVETAVASKTDSEKALKDSEKKLEEAIKKANETLYRRNTKKVLTALKQAEDNLDALIVEQNAPENADYEKATELDRKIQVKKQVIEELKKVVTDVESREEVLQLTKENIKDMGKELTDLIYKQNDEKLGTDEKEELNHRIQTLKNALADLQTKVAEYEKEIELDTVKALALEEEMEKGVENVETSVGEGVYVDDVDSVTDPTTDPSDLAPTDPTTAPTESSNPTIVTSETEDTSKKPAKPSKIGQKATAGKQLAQTGEKDLGFLAGISMLLAAALYAVKRMVKNH